LGCVILMQKSEGGGLGIGGSPTGMLSARGGQRLDDGEEQEHGALSIREFRGRLSSRARPGGQGVGKF
ncbi:MAG: hypothetical protein EOP59_16785, partial [Sphingomonadales bacterium]